MTKKETRSESPKDSTNNIAAVSEELLQAISKGSQSKKRKLVGRLLKDLGALLSDLGDLLNEEKDGPTNVTHTGAFTNKEGDTVNDLHVEFDEEGVEVVDSGKPGFPTTKTEKKTVTLSGNNVNANGFAKIKFKRADGEFKVVQWYWTKDGDKVGDIKKGPPNKDDSSGDWV